MFPSFFQAISVRAFRTSTIVTKFDPTSTFYRNTSRTFLHPKFAIRALLKLWSFSKVYKCTILFICFILTTRVDNLTLNDVKSYKFYFLSRESALIMIYSSIILKYRCTTSCWTPRSNIRFTFNIFIKRRLVIFTHQIIVKIFF